MSLHEDLDMNRILSAAPLARGRTADVYAWDDGHVLKLFHNWFKLDDIEYELKIARAVHASGVESPLAGDLVQLQGHNGLIYERVEGESMLTMFQRKPWKVFTYARTLAGLHAQMHDRSFNADIPDQRGKLQRKIQGAEALPVSLKTALSKALETLPEGNRVCHGDFHPANVLVSGGNATVIDWIDASRGNPLADVARTSIIIMGAIGSQQIPDRFSKLFVGIFHRTYLHEYFRLHPHGENEYHRWLPIVAGARLSEAIPELEQWLVNQAHKVI